MNKYRCLLDLSVIDKFEIEFLFENLLLTCSQTAVHRSFAIADNLGEVSAKGQVLYNISSCHARF